MGHGKSEYLKLNEENEKENREEKRTRRRILKLILVPDGDVRQEDDADVQDVGGPLLILWKTLGK